MDNPELKEIWDKIIEYEIADEGELRLATNVAGYTLEVLNAVIYSRTGYNSIEQFEGE